MTTDPNLSTDGLRVAALVTSGEGQTAVIERAPGLWESRGVGNSYLLTTAEGDVLVNAGTLADARRGREQFAKVSANPIRYIVLTQSHAASAPNRNSALPSGFGSAQPRRRQTTYCASSTPHSTRSDVSGMGPAAKL